MPSDRLTSFADPRGQREQRAERQAGASGIPKDVGGRIVASDALICRRGGVAVRYDQPPEDASAVVPEVAFFRNEPVGPETE
jgi:hypothetical protein